jgi:murein DD-endopeptidase MepM/ murein hydrolase activator NlpD
MGRGISATERLSGWRGDDSMAKKFYTVLVVPDASSQIRTLHVPRLLLIFLSVLASLGFAAFLFLFYQSLSLNSHMLELRRLRAAVAQQSQLQEKIDRLEGEMGRIREFDTQLRLVAGLDMKAGDGPWVGVGGEEGVSSRSLVAAASAHETPSFEGLARELDRLGREITDRSQSFQELIEQLESKRSVLASTPTIWPVQGWLTAGFGHRRSPFTGQRQMHEGVDISNTVGTPIVAPANGVVSYVGPLGGFGNVISIDHGHNISTFYAHLHQQKVARGQRVKRGDLIGLLGTSGRVTGPHLHYEISVNGAPVDPGRFVIDTQSVRFLGDGDSAE